MERVGPGGSPSTDPDSSVATHCKEGADMTIPHNTPTELHRCSCGARATGRVSVYLPMTRREPVSSLMCTPCIDKLDLPGLDQLLNDVPAGTPMAVLFAGASVELVAV